MIKYRWVRLEDITRWLVDGVVTEIGFTNDHFEDESEGFEPTEWHGMKLVKEFDGESLIFGYWGSGIEFVENYFDDGIIGAIKEYFKDYLDWEISPDTKICCEAEGLPLVEVYESDGFYTVEFNGNVVFNNIIKDRAEDIKWALEEGVKYGKELAK